MGNALRCLEGQEDHVGGDHYPYYRPASGSPTIILQAGIIRESDTDVALPPSHQQVQGPHGVTASVAAPDQYILDFNSTSMVTYTVLSSIPSVSQLCLSCFDTAD
jgi:hypothetical protein